jgi:hypothetical protein
MVGALPRHWAVVVTVKLGVVGLSVGGAVTTISGLRRRLVGDKARRGATSAVGGRRGWRGGPLVKEDEMELRADRQCPRGVTCDPSRVRRCFWVWQRASTCFEILEWVGTHVCVTSYSRFNRIDRILIPPRYTFFSKNLTIKNSAVKHA